MDNIDELQEEMQFIISKNSFERWCHKIHIEFLCIYKAFKNNNFDIVYSYILSIDRLKKMSLIFINDTEYVDYEYKINNIIALTNIIFNKKYIEQELKNFLCKENNNIIKLNVNNNYKNNKDYIGNINLKITKDCFEKWKCELCENFSYIFLALNKKYYDKVYSYINMINIINDTVDVFSNNILNYKSYKYEIDCLIELSNMLFNKKEIEYKIKKQLFCHDNNNIPNNIKIIDGGYKQYLKYSDESTHKYLKYKNKYITEKNKLSI